MRALAVAAAVLAGTGAARAEEIPRLHVVWEAPAGCPERGAFLAQLADHLDGVAPASPMHVEVVIEPAERDLVLTLRTRHGGSDGERQLRGRDCAVLAETAALTLALAIAPEAVKAGRRERGLDDEIPGGGRVDRAAPVAGPADGQEWGIPLEVRAGMHGELGGLPGISPGFGIAAGARIGRSWRVEAMASFWLEKTAADPEDADVAAELMSVAAGARTCVDLFGRRLVAGLCAGLELTRTRGEAINGPEPSSFVWFSAMAGPSISWNLSRSLRLRLDLEAVGRPFRRPQFTVLVPGISPLDPDEQRVVHKPAWVGVRAGLGVEAYFP